MTQVVERPGEAAELSPWQIGGRRRGRRRRLMLGLAGAFAAVSVVFGLPTGREVVVGWLLLLLLAVVGGDLPAWRRAVLHDWLPLLLVLFGYDALRGFTHALAGRAHITQQIAADRLLFHGHVPTVWLQQHLYAPTPSWYDDAIVPVYLSHFLVPTALAAGLWATSHRRFRTYAWSLSVLSAASLLTYAVFPADPPWLAAQTTGPDGRPYLPSVVRIISHTLAVGGIPTVHSALERGDAYANPVAAVPSLHSAVPMLIVLLSWPYCHRLGHSLLLLYLTAMTFTLVYTGEHYVIDVLLGWSYAAASVAGVNAAQALLPGRRGRTRGDDLSRSPGSHVPTCPPSSGT